MSLLIAGLVIFIGIHLVPHFADFRAQWQSRLGEQGYKGVFSLLSAIGLILIIFGMIYSDFIHFYSPPPWGRDAARALMLPALILLCAANLPTNFKRWLQHPMLIGLLLWSAAHLLANGDAASLLLFGGFAIFAIFDLWSVIQRRAAAVKIYPRRNDIIAVGIGVAVYITLLFAHPYLFGVAIIT